MSKGSFIPQIFGFYFKIYILDIRKGEQLSLETAQTAAGGKAIHIQIGCSSQRHSRSAPKCRFKSKLMRKKKEILAFPARNVPKWCRWLVVCC